MQTQPNHEEIKELLLKPLFYPDFAPELCQQLQEIGVKTDGEGAEDPKKCYCVDSTNVLYVGFWFQYHEADMSMWNNLIIHKATPNYLYAVGARWARMEKSKPEEFWASDANRHTSKYDHGYTLHRPNKSRDLPDPHDSHNTSPNAGANPPGHAA